MSSNWKIILLEPGESKLWTLGAHHEWVKIKSQKLGHVLCKTNVTNFIFYLQDASRLASREKLKGWLGNNLVHIYSTK